MKPSMKMTNEIIPLLKSSIVVNDFSCIKSAVRFHRKQSEYKFPLPGHIQSRVVYFLMNIHVLPRTIYLTRVTFR